ncbi:nucleoid occlusion protein [Bacillus xiamenensis]|uniref:Nucleoid occlusion protein n=1 Tax=Bacillus xiamenensis TaxID=1178537 RepID=A0AAC9IFK3_9BACI|nr:MULTISPECIES: nucleoid occlusion protein [Bacillus]AOZ88685.1 nucleoid occlusion protein [Bacillus xiamenensis]EKF34287.1 stage 0 DNA-binding protein [Bacillus xiamenensis]MBG9911679.1 chromosome partitioning protein ParB [Bacillus xiamenensis]MCW1836934.1 nucleoid occlusion protein [Bacillus xiamenensis]MCY9575820.1 nucleoid occlusion protein [Bacillus xiamenensis]
MKHSLSRFFGLGDKEHPEHETELEAEIAEHDTLKEEIQELPVDTIMPNRFQPRTIFSQEKIQELATTIHTHGIIQPIVVRPTEEEGKYELIAGERRWRAVQTLQWEKIPAIIKDFTDTETASVALIENLQREELSAIEEAHAYARLLELHDLTQEALAQRLGKGQSTVANKLRLLKLPEEVQQAILEKKISERHARSLVPLKLPELQITLLQEIIEKQLNVKQTEERVVKMLEQKTDRKPKPKRKAFSRDTRIAMNTIRQSLHMVEDSGLKINTEEEEFEEYIQLTIRIPK